MSKMKKMVAMLLALMLCASLLAACGETEEKPSDGTTATEAPTPTVFNVIPSETVTLTCFSQLANYSGEMSGWFAKVMLDKFNVKINLISDVDGAYATRMEAGDLGDIVVFGSDTDDYIGAINAGLLFDWEEDEVLADFGPSILENMPQALEKNKNLNPDGKIHGFGHNVSASANDNEAFFYYPDIRWDLYKELGYPSVKTLEDYIPLLKDMVGICPTDDIGNQTYGVSMWPDWDGDMVMMVKSTGALYGYDEFGFGLYDTKTMTYEPCLKEGGMYLRCLKFYNDMYRLGLVDPDSMTQTYTDAAEAYANGTALWNIFNYAGSANYNTEEHLAAGKAMYPLAADDATNIVYGLSVYGGNRVWTIGSKTQYPELCMTIINWFCTPEGRMTCEYGPQGLCWDYDADKKPYLTELGLTCKADRNTSMPEPYSGLFGEGSFQINNTTWSLDASNPDSNGATYNYKMWDSYNAAEATPILQDWRDFTGFITADSYIEEGGHISVAVATSYSVATKSAELKTTWQQVADCIKEYSWNAIYAKTEDEYNTIVAEMIQKCNDYGYAECVAFYENETTIRSGYEKAALGIE